MDPIKFEQGVKMAKIIKQAASQESLRKLAERITLAMAEKGLIEYQDMFDKRDELIKEGEAKLLVKEAALEMVSTEDDSTAIFAEDKSSDDNEISKTGGLNGSQDRIDDALEQFAINALSITN